MPMSIRCGAEILSIRHPQEKHICQRFCARSVMPLFPSTILCKGRLMFNTVELPVWALVLICLLAGVTAASHLLFPSVRWFFRRRAERVVARLNTRLTRPIQPFKLAQRHDMIQQILYDPDVIRAVNAYADENKVPDNVAFETAERYAREIVPAFSASVYFGFGARAARWLATALYRVRVVNQDRNIIRDIDPDATVVAIMNHRSNMDYVLVTYLVAGDTPLSYAVGEWARRWPLRPLIKMMGGYFIRRKSLNALYRKVLARYVQLATKEGVVQAVFPEGGLSRTGGLLEPKLGILSYITADFDPSGSRDIVFLPVGLNYDRVLEDRTLINAAGNGKTRFRFRWLTVLRYVGRHLGQRLTGRFHKLGMAAVSFGEPVSLKALMQDRGEMDPKDLAAHLMHEVGKAVPILPVPLIARHLVSYEGAAPLDVLKSAFGDEDAQAPMHEALRMLEVRGVVTIQEAHVRVADGFMPLMTYYAATIEHVPQKILENFAAT